MEACIQNAKPRDTCSLTFQGMCFSIAYLDGKFELAFDPDRCRAGSWYLTPPDGPTYIIDQDGERHELRALTAEEEERIGREAKEAANPAP
jgi:hypothetical protein